jgi:crotonobetainyl-CoA:carnitine CoA-transferase CaiB-like acyl-CoA transferase
MCLTDKFWTALLGVLGRPDIDTDPRFSSPSARSENRDALTEALDAEFRRQPTRHWLAALGGVLPISPVYDLASALENPFLQENGMVSAVPHPARADMRVLSNPLKINGQRLSQRVCSAPGADNDALLGGGQPGLGLEPSKTSA